MIMSSRSIVKDILICFSISILLVLLCFPEFLIPPKIAYALNGEYVGAYIMTNWLYHGGLQLWDRYDQMSFAYFILTNGMIKIFQVLTAIVYWCISPFVCDQAKAFHHTFSIVYLLTNLFLKV